MRKWMLALGAGLGATGCLSPMHVSSFGPLVHAIEVRQTAQGGVVVIETCDLEYTEVTRHYMVGKQSQSDTDRTLGAERCSDPRPVEVLR
jgi:hypothetical protein